MPHAVIPNTMADTSSPANALCIILFFMLIPPMIIPSINTPPETARIRRQNHAALAISLAFI